MNKPLLDLAVQLKRNRTINELQRHKQLVDKKVWYQSPAQVDALYMPNLNKVTIPFAIMQFPFLSRVPNYASFALIGTIIRLIHFCLQFNKYTKCLAMKRRIRFVPTVNIINFY